MNAPSSQLGIHVLSVPGYEIIKELGRGSMGVVYAAMQRSTNRVLALKMIRQSALASPQELGRFRIEAEVAARMRHPNIVQIQEMGEFEGLPFFAMELVEGGSLSNWLAARPESAKNGPDWYALVARLVRDLAQAVDHAHQRGVLHRDLKPANVLLQFSPSADDSRKELTEAEQITPKLTDFGLARRLDTESTAWTQAGAILGSVSYMAPEQATGRVRELGPAADIYGLGAVLYELLTGRPPFQGASWNETVLQVLNDEPASPARLRASVPCDLETICLKCLEKSAQLRYPTAADLANDLTRFIEGNSVTAIPVDERGRVARLAARDGFRIVEEIGRGPRSIVYRAVNERLEQPVALKVFEPDICTQEEWKSRMQRGSELWAGLAHPQVMPAHHTGWWDRAPYVAFEWVPRGSLATRLSGLPFPLHEAVRLVEQLTVLMGYIHRQGIVHGNLKPSNIMLSTEDVPRLLDFHFTGGHFLKSGSSVGPRMAYLAPELLRDPTSEPRLTADIYGLGAILYELITGYQPASSRSETVDTPHDSGVLPASAYNPAVSPLLDTICRRCLSVDPWHRYTRAYNLLMSLRACLRELEGGKPSGPPTRR